MRKARLFCATLAACLLAGCGSAVSSGQSQPAAQQQNPVVATVAGEPVTLAEYQGYAYDYLAQAALNFSTRYGADANQAEFWQTEYDGQTPLAWVKEQADAYMTRNKGVQVLAQQLGLYDEISWEEQDKNFASENQLRAEKVAAGEVIYGPKQLTRSQFSSYWQSQVEQLVKDHVKYEILDPSEEALQQYYQQHKDQLNQLNFTTRLELVYWSQTAGSEDAVQIALQAAQQGATAAEISAMLQNELDMQTETATANLDTNAIPKEDYDIQALVEQVRNVQAGVWAGSFELSGTQGLVFVAEKDWETIGTFEQARELIDYYWRLEESTRYIQEKIAEMPIEYLPAWEEITIEQLRIAD